MTSHTELPALMLLGSGQGKLAEAIAEATLTGQLQARIGGVASNKPAEDAQFLPRMEAFRDQHGLDFKIEHIIEDTPDAQSESLKSFAYAIGAKVVILAGYNRIVDGPFFDAYGFLPDQHTHKLQSHMLNFHPASLPLTQGLMGEKASAKVLEHNRSHTHQILHAVGPTLDDERLIVAKRVISVPRGATSAELNAKVQASEHRHGPGQINDFLLLQSAYETNERLSSYVA